ncbi:MAG: hypothetical protein ACLFQ0_16660 [Cyclobacteriaceae bacterium]
MKRVIRLISGLFGGTVFLIGAIMFLAIAILPYNIHKGKVVSDGVENRRTRTGIKSDNENYYLMVSGIDDTLRWYTMTQDYSVLLQKIKEGDEVEVQYIQSEIFEITKGDDKLIGNSSIFNKNVLVGLLCAISGIFFYWLSFRFYNKKRIPKWIMRLNR